MPKRFCVTKRVEFDAGHRVQGHEGKCRNMHGHRYRLEGTFSGPLRAGGADEGMVVDFGKLKEILINVSERYDHGFIVCLKDMAARTALNQMGSDHKTVLIDRVPTAENLAALIYVEVLSGLRSSLRDCDVVLDRIRLYETPNSWADVSFDFGDA